MDTLHLLWIVPLSAAVGLMIAAIARVSKDEKEDEDPRWDETPDAGEKGQEK